MSLYTYKIYTYTPSTHIYKYLFIYLFIIIIHLFIHYSLLFIYSLFIIIYLFIIHYLLNKYTCTPNPSQAQKRQPPNWDRHSSGPGAEFGNPPSSGQTDLTHTCQTSKKKSLRREPALVYRHCPYLKSGFGSVSVTVCKLSGDMSLYAILYTLSLSRI